jgi:hypothetical protein
MMKSLVNFENGSWNSHHSPMGSAFLTLSCEEASFIRDGPLPPQSPVL